MTKSFKIINSLDGMILKGMDKCSNNTGKVSATVLPLDVTGLTFLE